MRNHIPITNQTLYFEYLKDVRLANGMTLTEVSRKSQLGNDAASKISLSILSKIESGRVHNPRIGTVVKLVRGYGIPMDAFEYFFSQPYHL